MIGRGFTQIGTPETFRAHNPLRLTGWPAEFVPIRVEHPQNYTIYG
jgi:hypothetical protein